MTVDNPTSLPNLAKVSYAGPKRIMKSTAVPKMAESSIE